MRLRPSALASVLCLSLLAPSAHAAIIEYDVTNLSGSTWRYDYTVTNNSLESTLDEFTVFFARALYQNIEIGGAPVGWDPLAIEPDLNLPDDGFYDALALGAGLAPGAILGGFSSTFTWLGTGTPGIQPFDIVDPANIDPPLESGFTQLRVTAPPTSVPEPSVLTLFAGALALLLVSSRFERRFIRRSSQR